MKPHGGQDEFFPASAVLLLFRRAAGYSVQKLAELKYVSRHVLIFIEVYRRDQFLRRVMQRLIFGKALVLRHLSGLTFAPPARAALARGGDCAGVTQQPLERDALFGEERFIEFGVRNVMRFQVAPTHLVQRHSEL
jgi:hypothetical protein